MISGDTRSLFLQGTRTALCTGPAKGACQINKNIHTLPVGEERLFYSFSSTCEGGHCLCSTQKQQFLAAFDESGNMQLTSTKHRFSFDTLIFNFPFTTECVSAHNHLHAATSKVIPATIKINQMKTDFSLTILCSAILQLFPCK